MAHFAKLGANNKVIAVHVVNDSDCLNANGVEDEEVGRQFLERIHHWPLWKKTSYNTHHNTHSSGDNSKALRGNYAGIGMIMMMIMIYFFLKNHMLVGCLILQKLDGNHPLVMRQHSLENNNLKMTQVPINGYILGTNLVVLGILQTASHNY